MTLGASILFDSAMQLFYTCSSQPKMLEYQRRHNTGQNEVPTKANAGWCAKSHRSAPPPADAFEAVLCPMEGSRCLRCLRHL